MKQTNNWLNRILSILLICVMISQTCFSVYGANQDAATEHEATDTQSETTAESVSETDAASKLTLSANETQSLTLTTDMEYTGIELGEGSTLSVNTQGHALTVTGDITGKGKLTLTGKDIKVQNISVSDLVFDGATVDASETDSSKENTHEITAAESLTIQNSEISNAAFLGYDEKVTGNRTLTFGGAGNKLSDIALVGTKQNADVNVLVSGVSLISNSTNTSFCYDNKITYKDQDNEISAAESWPVSYRAAYSGNTADATVTGYHTSGTEENPGAFVANGNVPLPEYTKDGYVYQGWMLGESTDVITSLPQKLSGDITLQASMAASELTVTTDLGYEPSADTNDDYAELNKEENQAAAWGETLTLSTPSRFGYDFAGWKVTKENSDIENQTSYTGSYTTSLQDATQTDNGSYSIRLTAQWTAKSFPFRFFVKDADVAKLQVKVGETLYDSVQAFADAYQNITWNPQTSQFDLPDFQYGETLSSYLSRIGISEMPTLVDTRDAESKQDFEGWTTPGGNLLADDIAFVLGGILDNKANAVTLATYETSIHSTPLFLTSIWKNAGYKLTVKNANGWEILVNNNVQTLDENGNAELTVQMGSSITFRTSAGNPENFSMWNFSDGFLPEETIYSSGTAYISYIATMPYHDVSADYKKGTDTYIDIAQSAITFAENVQLPSGRTADGFWYDKKMEATTSDGMNVNAMTPAFQEKGKYFYIWNFEDSFYVTSCRQETQNQLTLVNAVNIVLKDCKLTATDIYKEKAVKRKLNDILLEGRLSAELQTALSAVDLRQYGNIILDVETHQKYTAQITVDGENALGVIVQSHFDGSTAYNGTLNVNGTTGKTTDELTISGTLLNETLNFTNVTLSEDTTVSSDYLLYTSATNEGVGNISFAGCDIKAENKRIHTYRGSLTFKNSKNEASSMDIGGARTYGPSNVRENSYIRCRGDWLGTYNTFYQYDNASIVIDGNLLTTYSHWTAGAIINTKGFLIVKGNRADLENLQLTNGTVIANAALLGRSCDITGGTLITNQLMNSPEKYPGADKDGNYVYQGTSNCEKAATNDDNYPFVTYSQNNTKKGEFVFGGTSKIYLLGYYKTSADRVYDTSVTATDMNNPVSKVVGKVIAEDGNVNTSATLSDTELQNMVKNSSYSQNECVIIGNSTYHTVARMRSVLVSGAEIYAAGNLTFFNDTEITAGSVYCNGTLSGKRDLSIGGTAQVTAAEIGNNYNLTTTDDSNIIRWQKTTISGGTITTDCLGAVSKAYVPDSTMVSRSTLVISDNPTIQARTAGNSITYATDIYLNYLADQETFTLPDNLPVSVRYTGNDYQNLMMDGQAVTLTSPTLKTGDESAAWALDSLAGESVDTINTDATFSFNNGKLTDKNAYKERENICFYAVKNTYDLSVAEGKDQISGIQVGNTVYSTFNSAIAAGRGTKVTVTLKDTSMAGKTVIWYQDAAGKFYNVNPTEKTENNQTILTFTMPAASVQIYVTNEMKLYLNRYEISVTADGFRTQYDAEADGESEYSFTYAGDLVITQDNLKSTEFVEGGTIGVNGISENETVVNKTKLTPGATKNRLHIESVNKNRNITLNKIIMDGGLDEDKIIIEKNCGDVELQIDGAVRVLSTYLQTGSNLIWKGKNQKAAGESDQDILQFDSGTSGTANSTGFINNGTGGQTGNVTFDSLNIIRSKEYYATGLSARRPLVYSYAKNPSAAVTFKNCNMTATVESSMSLVCNYPEVTVENSDFSIKTNTAWNSVFFSGCDKVTIKGGSLSYSSGAAYDSYSLYYGVKDFCIDGAKVSLTNVNSKDGDAYRMIQPDNMIPDAFTVKNAGELKVDHRIKLKKLTLTSDGDEIPKVIVGQETNGVYDGSLLCKDITVENGEIHTGRLLISGYYSAPYSAFDYLSKTEILAQLRAGNYLAENGTLTLKQGTIVAAEEIGGALGGTITVTGGKITSPAIGSCDKLYGYGQYLPTEAENEWIYSINKIPEQLTVQVNGGTVNIPSGGYLGGMNTSVNVTGGDMNLLGDAVLGMTETQKKELADYYSSKGDNIASHTDKNCLVTISGGSVEMEESETASGSIRAPYGSVKISGKDTRIKVSNMQAEHGNIEIRESQGGYENPYTGSENGQYKKDKIGIWVTDTLSAQTVNISDNAQVYAANAYAEISNGTGSLTVKEAALYSKAYGEKGISRKEEDKQYNDTSNANDQTVFGTRMVSVTYELNPQNVIFEDDLTKVENDNPTSYVVTSADAGTLLMDAACKGYNFLGWYTDEECSGNKVEKLNTTISNDLTLYAKWEKIKVKFQVMMDQASASDYYNETEFTDNSNWKVEDDHYVSTKQVELSYGDSVLTTNGVNLMDYTTNTLGITELEIQETDYSGSKTINAGTTVSRDLAEFYKTKAAKDPNAVLILHVKNVQKRIATVRFSVNKKDGKPADAVFANNSIQISANVGVDKEIGEVSAFGDPSVTEGKSTGLVQPKATGYTFIGWNTNASATKDTEDGWVTSQDVFNTDITVYAIWQVNTYLVEFNAGEGSWVTSKNEAPQTSASTVKTLSYYWVYDTPVSTGQSFWLKGTSNNEYMTEMPYAWQEGYVFEHDNGWTCSYTDENTGETVTEVVTSAAELSKQVEKALNTAIGDPNGNPTQTALKLTANYTPVTVTYHLNDGTWTGENTENKVTPAYGMALAGYVKEADSSQDSGENSSDTTFRKIAVTTGENGSRYYVTDTTATYFDTENNQYVAGDYRNSLTRKGYTFYGWYQTQDEANAAITDNTNTSTSVGTTPRFSNVDLYAAWKPNSYTLQIKNKDASKTYAYTIFGVPGNTSDSNETVATQISVTTGQEIDANNWPSRNFDNAWYVQDNNVNADTTKRYFLGATFAALDPGAKTEGDAGKDIYDKYVNALSELEKVDGLYQNKVNDGLKGTVFQLPDDTSYRKAIADMDVADTYTVPDYPDGCDITMYAVYREQSIVFVERYVDKEGKVRENIKNTADCNTWSNYPTNYSNPDLNFSGYTLVGWYVNTTEANEASRYPDNAETYKNKLESYTQEAADQGTYDIMVYTVYAPEVNNGVQLNAQSDPTSTSISTSTYTLPGSMQTGSLNMTLSDMTKGLQLISKEEMLKHEYDSSWKDGDITYTSATAVAIQITVVHGSGKDSVTKDLSEQSNGMLAFDNLEIGAGDQITLALYHSRVMTKTSSYSFALNVGFTKTDSDGKNTLENQKINNTVTVNLTPSMYTVNYSMELPETPDKLTVLEANGQEDWGDFSRPENNAKTITKQVKIGYGSALLMNFPKLEGYTAKTGWQITGDTTTNSTLQMYQNLTMKVSAENKGVIHLSSGYEVQKKQLSISSKVLEHWRVTYSDGPDGTTETELAIAAGEVSAKATVNYHSVIKFTPKNSSNADPAEFVTLTLGTVSDSSTTKLPDYATVDANGTYTFTMPAQDVTGSYVTVETLYLEDGTISITENGYTHGDVQKIWRGDYQILQNAKDDDSKATANTLILANDLSKRTITLGKLNISSDNSIELKAQSGESNAAEVTLTMDAGSTITAKNIQVPADCELTLSGSADTISNTLKLSPNKTNAGVGGTADEAANGKITLSNLQMSLTMPAGSTASGIGPVSRDTEGAKLIALTNCDISVEEQSTTEVYQGVWIGGNNVPEVTMNKVKLNAGGSKNMAGPVITSGKTVNITDSMIGTTEKYVSDPVYAVESLNINNSKIYMNIQDNISGQAVNVPIGTSGANGTTNIQKSEIKVIKTRNGQISDIYSGIMKIADADSNVLIDGTQLVEITNGSVRLNGKTYTQAAKSPEADDSRKNYRLLGEGTVPSTAPDLTVEALPENGHVEIQQPLSDGRTSVGVGKLTIQKNTEFILNGNLDVNGEAVIKTQEGAPITVKVTADSNYGISFKDSGTVVFKEANGSTYVQNGGSLSSASDFSDASLNVTLNNVTTTVPNLYADELTIDGGSVTGTAIESKVGSMPAENGVSGVTIKNASVTAGTIGALGTYDKMFTTVTTEKATLNGKLVQDHYRLKYDIGRATLDTTSLPKTVRTETQMPADSGSDPSVSVLPENGIPGNPTGTDSKLFGSWYINDKTGTRKALLAESAALPAGLKVKTTLNGTTLADVKTADVAESENKDGTKTLTVHAWMNVTGTVTVKKGRLFQNFTGGTAAVSVQSNGAWTAQLVSTGTAIEKRDYQVTFDTALPIGTTLTLTEPATENTAGKYYWYKVSSENVSSVKFTQFTVMGGTETFRSVTKTENIPENETFLLSADFSEASAEVVSNQNITFQLLPSEGTTEDAVTIGKAVTYSLSAVSKGKISISGQDVTVESLPIDADRLKGQKLFLKAVINKKDSSETGATIPYYVTAKWKETSGTWISRDTVLFEMGEYDSMKQGVSGAYTFTGLENGTYQISWSTVYGKEASGNIAGNVVSNTARTDYTENHVDPSLKVTTDTTSRVIAAGTGTSLTFNCTTDSENVTVAVEKQGELCEFTEDKSGMITVQPVVNGQTEVVFRKNVEGTYRIRFSINDQSTEDDVYFVFIVE